MQDPLALQLQTNFAPGSPARPPDTEAIEGGADDGGSLAEVRRENAALRAALERSEERMGLLFRATTDAFWEDDIAGGTVTLSPAWQKLLGVVDQTAAGEDVVPFATVTRNLMEFVHPDDRERVKAARAAFAAGQKDGLDVDFRLIAGDGQVRWVQSRVVAAPGRDGSAPRVVGALTDITARRRREAEKEQVLRQAEQRADRDPLTGLLNHRAFYQRLHDEAERTGRDSRSFALAVLDIDNFKFFNDAFGHLDGDEVLVRVADALRASFRVYDVLARIGGDEFALILPGMRQEEAERLFEEARLAHGIFTDGFTPSGQDSPVPLRLSFGVAVFPEEAESPLGALGLADERLFRNKRQESENDDARCERVRATLQRRHPGFASLYSLLTAVDAKDRYTRRHSERVLLLTREMMREAGGETREVASSPDHRDAAEIAGMLHDVGKIGIPDHILRRPARLSEDEYSRVKHHPSLGAALVRVMMPEVPAEAAEAIRHHHEAWDGSGYPDGLRGEGIPLLARVISVAESFSALTTDRPYRRGLSVSDALTVLRAGAGTRWDPACVSLFEHTYAAALLTTSDHVS